LDAEKKASENRVAHFQNKMPRNERRTRNWDINIITGELKDEQAASVVREFTGSTHKAELAHQQEVELVLRREEAARIKTARIGCRYNNGRMAELKDYSIISGDPMKVGWDASVKMGPSVWEWCKLEQCAPSE
jgi:hypothetical protein